MLVIANDLLALQWPEEMARTDGSKRNEHIEDSFRPGVAAQKCIAALANAGGSELGSGKLLSPESGSAVAADAFGWFYDRPELLPSFKGLRLGLGAR